MSLVLVTKEDLENQALAHYRVGGEKKGVRKYQNEDGSLTPLGRIHYGVGLGRDRSGTSVIIGKRQVKSDGTVTRTGARRIEDSSKGGYLNPTVDDVKKGKAKEREAISKQYEEEYREAVKNGMPDNSPSELGKELWDKYKEKYAEATLKDLKFPVNDKNKEIVEKTFEKYDRHYKYEDDEEHVKEVEKNHEERFKKPLGERTDKELKKDAEESVNKINSAADKIRNKANEREAKRQKLKQQLLEVKDLSDEELKAGITRLQLEKQYSELLTERADREKSEFERTASKLVKEAAENLAKRTLNDVVNKLLEKNKNKEIVRAAEKSKESKPEDKKDDSSGSPKPATPTPPASPTPGTKFSKPEKSRIRSMASAGKSIAEIASALGTTEDRVKGYMAAAGITTS